MKASVLFFDNSTRKIRKERKREVSNDGGCVYVACGTRHYVDGDRHQACGARQG